MSLTIPMLGVLEVGLKLISAFHGRISRANETKSEEFLLECPDSSDDKTGRWHGHLTELLEDAASRKPLALGANSSEVT